MQNRLFNALVLAGGKSSRMGQDKGLLRFADGQTLIQHASLLLKRLGADEVFVSSHNTDIVDALTDLYPEQGPVSGIHAALAAAQKTAAQKAGHQAPLLVMPVDMPLMSTNLLSDLIEQCFSKEQSCCFEDQCLPLMIYDTQQALEASERLLSAEGNVSVWLFLKVIKANEIPTPETDCFKNANTPAQWIECQGLL